MERAFSTANIYSGKIAYGRRKQEKVKGTKCEYRQVNTDDYILEDGQHEVIVGEELWQRVNAKRVATGIKQPSKVVKDRSHLLTGILKCPACGGAMYTNKHAWTNKDGTYKEECVKVRWSVRQLERQINTMYYDRILAGNDKSKVADEINQLEPKPEYEKIIKKPYVLEFLDLEAKKKIWNRQSLTIYRNFYLN